MQHSGKLRLVIAAAILSMTATGVASQHPMPQPMRPGPYSGYMPMPQMPPGREIPSLKPPYKLTSCMANIDLKVSLDDDWLDRAVDVKAQASNTNTVPLGIYHSFVRNGTLFCQYRSANQDIPNLVYRFPCRNGVRAHNGYAHAWRCQ